MVDYNKWKRKKLSPTRLKLDDENLRLSGFEGKPNQRQIIHYMVENENILKLAKNVAKKGYFPNEDPIVYKDGNRYVVLEGNRRVTACKLLIQPSSAPKRKVRSFENAAKGFNLEFIRFLYCRVAPSKEDADILIENRHTNTEIEKWDRIKQYRFYYLKFKEGKSLKYLANRFNRTEGYIGKMIRRYKMFEIAKKLELDSFQLEQLADETKLEITNLERFYESSEGKEFLGLGAEEDGQIKHLIPEEEFKKRYRRVVSDFLSGDLDSRTFGNSEDQNRKFITEIFATEEGLDSTIVPEETVEIAFQDEKIEKLSLEEDEKPKKTTKRRSTTTLIPKNWVCNSDIERINRICEELKGLSLGSKPNAALVLFRSFLEMVTYQYLEGKGAIPEIKKLAGEEKKKDANKGRKKLKENLLTKFDIPEEEITENALKRMIPQGSLKKDWTPSLYNMLKYIARPDSDLAKNPRMKEGLNQYLRLKGNLLTHHDFNGFVHNEYSITPSPSEIRDDWSGIRPLLKYMIDQISTDLNKQEN